MKKKIVVMLMGALLLTGCANTQPFEQTSYKEMHETEFEEMTIKDEPSPASADAQADSEGGCGGSCGSEDASCGTDSSCGGGCGSGEDCVEETTESTENTGCCGTTTEDGEEVTSGSCCGEDGECTMSADECKNPKCTAHGEDAEK